jgi:hypothetical protein
MPFRQDKRRANFDKLRAHLDPRIRPIATSISRCTTTLGLAGVRLSSTQMARDPMRGLN